MTTTPNGGDIQIQNLTTTLPWGNNGSSIDVTPDQALALVDDVMLNHGLNPARLVDPSGWRHITAGVGEAIVGVVDRGVAEPHLFVLVPVLNVPSDTSALVSFYRSLLELNHEPTLGAHFSIHDDIVHVVVARPLRGLDVHDIDDAIGTVITVANSYHERLVGLTADTPALLPVALREMPDIKLTPREAQSMRSVLSACDPHSREILRYILEGWQRAGHIVVVDSDTASVGLKIQLGSGPRLTFYTMAAVRLSLGQRPQLLVPSWEGVGGRDVFPPDAIDAFREEMAKIVGLLPDQRAAFVEVTEAFDRSQARALLWALRALAQSARLPHEEPYIWDPSLPSLDVRLGHKTLAGIQAALLACDPPVRLIYARLIEGWSQAGGTVHCYRPGRIYLRLRIHPSAPASNVARSRIVNLAVLAAPRGNRGPCIDVSWHLLDRPRAYFDCDPESIARFQAAVSQLPAFERQGRAFRGRIDGPFQMTHAERLLSALRDLKTAAEK